MLRVRCRRNVELVRRAYEAFNRGDPDAMVADIRPDAEWTVRDGAIVHGQEFVSREEALEAAGLEE
jgi:ketosteroid isomerase-like protein